MKKTTIILLLIFVSLLFVGCKDETGKTNFENDYPFFQQKDHVFVKGEYDEVYHALTKDEGVNIILFAYNPHFAECPFCLESIPIINEVALGEKVKKIIYFDVYQMRKERTDEYLTLLNYLDNQVDDLLTKNDQLEIIVPDIYVVKAGQILGHHLATLPKDGGGFYLNLTEEQVGELKNIYRDLFQLGK